MTTAKHNEINPVVRGLLWGNIFLFLIISAALSLFEARYKNRVYPTVSVGGIPFDRQTQQEVERFWLTQNEPFASKAFEFRADGHVATVSAVELELGYDATLSATQAYLVGRSPHLLSNLYAKFISKRTDLTPYFRWKTETLENTIEVLAEYVDIPVQDALFQFSAGKVTAFRPSRDGRRLNREEAIRQFTDTLTTVANSKDSNIIIPLSIETIKPSLTTDQVNIFGIRERIGRGFSTFVGSIPGRVHNVALAAARINGLLIKPGETFSFNNAVGDISAATGFQSAYIIKDGRTVLGDGGGVCQVSTTLFRAALNAGLPILERRAHAYRVHYYEDDGSKPGLDATVFAPSVDLKIENDTPAYILIQSKVDTQRMTLTFELYGASDGRRSEILDHRVWGVTPPPPPLYQDDPTSPAGVMKQVDFAAWGTNASFRYKVTRNGEVLQDQVFSSSFRPWQAVYLRGTQ